MLLGVYRVLFLGFWFVSGCGFVLALKGCKAWASLGLVGFSAVELVRAILFLGFRI